MTQSAPAAAEVCARLDAARARLTARPAPHEPQMSIEDALDELSRAALRPWPPDPEQER